MQLLRSIRDFQDEDDWWRPLLSTSRLEGVEKLFQDRQSSNEEICYSDCLQLADKTTIFKRTGKMLSLTSYSSKQQWEKFMRRVEDLRNRLAHSNDLGTGAWPQIAELALGMEKVLRSLEEGEAGQGKH
jgi:hypothetical protein